MKTARLYAPVALTFFVLVIAVLQAQTTRYIDGVFVAGNDGTPVELIAYADTLRTGEYRMAYGSLEDAPIVDEIAGVMVSLPGFTPRWVFVASAEIFRDYRAERRQVPVVMSNLNVYAVHLRIADLERREKIDELLAKVKASAKNPGYAFIAVESYDHIRYYPVRLTLPDD